MLVVSHEVAVMDSIQLLVVVVLVLILLVEIHYDEVLDVCHLPYLVHLDEMETHTIVMPEHSLVSVIQLVIHMALKRYVTQMQEVAVHG